VFLDLYGKTCVLIGGGKVAERKCMSLLKAGASVRVISPGLVSRLRTLKEKGRIAHIPRAYARGDIGSAFLVIAATDSEETNRQVAEEAQELGKLLNVVDTPSLCSFIVPSVFTRGLLTIAISTGGASPGLAREIRKELQGLYGPGFSKQLKVLRDIRTMAMDEIPDKKERERLLKEEAAKVLKRSCKRKMHRPLHYE
jgi:precorrin-2 dehydrogenase/sirohydrochlorin ferrochelatase